MKFYSFLLSCLTFLFLATPAYAGRLLFWRFESNQNRLVFTTDQSVQPTAQLIANPTRLVIDLPGTILGRPTVNESLGQLITNLRVGQFDPRTTRVVIEIAEGYTLDPQKIKIQGVTPTQWAVDIPEPQRITTSPTTPQSSNAPSSGNNNPSPPPATTSSSPSRRSPIQVTPSGILMGIEGNSRNNIKITRSRDRRQIEFEIEGVNISNDLINSWDVNQYGVNSIRLSQKRTSPPVALLTMNVNGDSPDWQGSFSRMGGLVLWPQGGMSRVESLSSSRNIPAVKSVSNPPSNSTRNNKAIIESINVVDNKLVIQGNQRLEGEGSWSQNGVYQIKINNADLAPNFQNPQLLSNSPLSRMRIWQPDGDTVILLVQPALGVRVENLSQPNERMLSLALNNNQRSTTTEIPLDPFNNTPSNSATIPVTPPPRNVTPPPQNNPQNKSRPLVVIDPGHGGRDPGAVGISGLQEKDVILPISQDVARILEQQGMQVRMTRNNDTFVSLEGRTNMANSINADLFVSIHANAISLDRPDVNGLETYYHQTGRNLAATIHRNILQRLNIRDRRVRQARFYVLRQSRMPSVLVEVGFVTGREDAANLRNPNFRRQMAEAIAAGIIEYSRANNL